MTGRNAGTASISFATVEQAVKIKNDFEGKDVGTPSRTIRLLWDRYKNQPEDEEETEKEDDDDEGDGDGEQAEAGGNVVRPKPEIIKLEPPDAPSPSPALASEAAEAIPAYMACPFPFPHHLAAPPVIIIRYNQAHHLTRVLDATK